MVQFMENPNRKWMITGGPPISGNLHINMLMSSASHVPWSGLAAHLPAPDPAEVYEGSHCRSHHVGPGDKFIGSSPFSGEKQWLTRKYPHFQTHPRILKNMIKIVYILCCFLRITLGYAEFKGRKWHSLNSSPGTARR